MPNHKIEDLVQFGDCEVYCEGLELDFKFLHFDSRLIEDSCGFLAMVGDSLDGHDFIEAAINNGASLVIAQKKCYVPSNVTLIVCKDPLKLLQDYASWYRDNKLTGFIIGVTGSVGKTSTKDSLTHLLSKTKCYASEGNYNNFLGLPLCLLKMTPNHQYGVFEAGISTPNEMGLLGEILKPNLMIVTNIHQSHMEFFQNKQELIEEKLKLSLFMRQGAPLFFPKDLLDLSSGLLRTDLKVIPFEDFELSESIVEKMGFGPAKSYELAKFVLKDFEIDFNTSEDFSLTHLRMQRKTKNNQEFLLDCYNASPESMRALFQSIVNVSDVIFVLADMLELGLDSELSHKIILKELVLKKPKKIILFGDIFLKACAEIENDSIEILSFSKIEDACNYLKGNPCDCIALKGSRFFALERIFQNF
ncbi:MAG: hypothetical protein KC646_05895 [Candidatus Cloacimonetes bacterium]|nr:hypothetical protein [Candidatus Cloacimonadota bacterium]